MNSQHLLAAALRFITFTFAITYLQQAQAQSFTLSNEFTGPA